MQFGRGAVIFTMLAIASPALAEAVLPIGGAYGDEAGCHAYLSGDFTADRFAVLTPHTFASNVVSCYFEKLLERAPRRSTIAASCEGVGEDESLDVVAVIEGSDAGGYRVTINNAGWDGLVECAGTEELFNRPGTQT
jgi:hypothetical protein